MDEHDLIKRLAAMDRASCSAGELEAAQLIAAELRRHGVEAVVERPRVHGTYWWPWVITSTTGLLAARAARAGRRGVAVALAALATAAVVDDINAGRRWLRAVLPKRSTANVLAWVGDPTARSTLIVVAHHDAAHTGIFFNPAITDALSRRAHWSAEAQAPPIMLPLALGPGLCAIGALPGLRRLADLGRLVCAGIILSVLNIAGSPTVPGANDNLTGVAILVGLARRLQSEPIAGLRVLLLSTGAEEALMDGMHAFARDHLATLDPTCTHVLCVDSVGSSQLTLAEEQGMLRLVTHDPDLNRLVSECAQDAGIPLRRGLRMRFGTDGYISARRGFPTALLMSLDDHGFSSNYHWPTDTPDRIDQRTLEHAFELCERVVRRLATGP